MPSLPENPEDFITAKFAQPGAGEMVEQLRARGVLQRTLVYSQHPHDVSQRSVAPAPGDRMPFVGTSHTCAHTYMQTRHSDTLKKVIFLNSCVTLDKESHITFKHF